MKKLLWIGSGVITAVLIFILCCFQTIDSASIGIRFYKWSSDPTKQGGVEGTCKGLVWYNPFTERIFEYPLYVQRVVYSGFQVNTRDAAIFTMTPNLAYRIEESRAIDIFIKYRKPIDELEDGYIKTAIHEAYRTCANNYTADELMSNRAKFETEVRERLNESMNNEGFVVTEFTTKIDPPASLVNAIDQKNISQQNALKAENQVKEAEANAKIAIAKAKGEGEALRITADAEAYYNKTVAASLNQLLVQQYAIEKWNGTLPTVTSSTTPFINLK